MNCPSCARAGCAGNCSCQECGGTGEVIVDDEAEIDPDAEEDAMRYEQDDIAEACAWRERG